MANEWDLQVAIVALCEADTGPGGLVELTGKAHPIVEWGDDGMKDAPVLALFLDDLKPGAMQGRIVGMGQIDAFAPPADEGLASRLLDRIQDVLRNRSLAAEGLDVAPRWGTRRNLTALEESGKRLMQEVEFRLTK